MSGHSKDNDIPGGLKVASSSSIKLFPGQMLILMTRIYASGRDLSEAELQVARKQEMYPYV